MFGLIVDLIVVVYSVVFAAVVSFWCCLGVGFPLLILRLLCFCLFVLTVVRCSLGFGRVCACGF